MKTIVITGASGFIGSFLCEQFLKNGFSVNAITHSNFNLKHPRLTVFSYHSDSNLQEAFKNADIVLHCAALAHDTSGQHEWPLYEKVNVKLTEHIAQATVAAKISKFIFLSSIKVFSDQQILESTPVEPLTEETPPLADSVYGKSKKLAEEALQAIFTNQSIEALILRLPLVYGKNPKANFKLLLKWARSGIPFPFAAVHNARSILGLPNLYSFCEYVLNHPLTKGLHVFHIADNALYSSAQLFGLLAKAQGKPARLLNAPPTILRVLLSLMGKKNYYWSLAGNAVLSTEKIKNTGWEPPYSTAALLAEIYTLRT